MVLFCRSDRKSAWIDVPERTDPGRLPGWYRRRLGWRRSSQIGNETDLIRSADHAKMCDRQSSFLMSDNPLQIYEKPMKNPPAPSPREKSYVIIYRRMRFWRSGFRNGTYWTGSRGIYKKGTMYAQRRQDKINDRTGTV